MTQTLRTRLLAALALLALFASVLSTATAVGAAEACTYSFQNNEAPDLKIKTVVDGREVTQILLTSGRTESITVSSDDTVIIRRPSDRERLFQASNCEGAGTVIQLGELPADIEVTCGVTQDAAGSEAFAVDVQLSDAPAGSYVAIKAYNPVDDEDYIFLGSTRTRGATDITLDKEIVDQPGDWRITARVRLADGSKLPRVDCAVITIGDGGQFRDGVIGNRPATELPTSCWAVDRALPDGTIVSDVTILNAGNPRVVYARTEDSFLGAIGDQGGTEDTDIALVKVRGGERQGTYDCARGWTGDAIIDSPDEEAGISEVDIEVIIAVPAADGGMNVLWKQGLRGPGIGNGGAMSYRYRLTNTVSGELNRPLLGDIEEVDADLVDCAAGHVAVTASAFGETYVNVVDLATGGVTRPFGFQANSTNYGFDCDGRFWYEGLEGPTSVIFD